jgi:transcriptional regulator with XRE-family HTH domain
MNTKELLGLKIKELRKAKKLTQEKLAEILDLDVGYISKLEVGRNFPTIGTLEKIAQVLEVEMYELFQYTKNSEKDFKTELILMYDNLNKEKQFLVYRIVKELTH